MLHYSVEASVSSRHDTWVVHIYYVDQHQPEAYASKCTHSCSSLTALNASFISSTVPDALTRLSYMVCRQVAYSRIIIIIIMLQGPLQTQ